MEMYPTTPVEDASITPDNRRTACIVDGCVCKDSRVLSYRRLGFVKAMRPDATPVRDTATLDIVDFGPVEPDRVAQRLAAIASGNL